MPGISRALLRRLWPSAPPQVLSAVVSSSADVFRRYRIDTPLRVAHFMAQISHESGGGTITAENLSYTNPARIAAVWPTRFTAGSAAEYVRNPRKLASKVYNGRMGNRPGTDDGYVYRGRGLLQLTGRSAYVELGEELEIDLVGNPDLAGDPKWMFEIAAAEFVKLKCLSPADKDNLREVTRRVNGGYNGLDDRRRWLAKWKTALKDIPDDPRVVRDAMDTTPRAADPEQPEKTMLSSTEGNAAAAGGAIGLLSAASDASDSVSNISRNAQEAGMFDMIGRVVASPKFLIGVAIVAIFAYLWFRRRWRLHVDLV